jgi:xanthine dehydrogenase YagS FAD-binding subunit
LDDVRVEPDGTHLGGLITLQALADHPVIARSYRALAEAAASVGTPQIRNVGTLAGNICQRPWCWYLRNDFPCFKNGGSTCFAREGENQFHAIFGSGPSYIVHPSDTAPALLALDARVKILGPSGARSVPARQFFAWPTEDPSRENVLREDEIVTGVILPAAVPGVRSTYMKLLDRESWTHALASVALTLDLQGGVCRRARIVLGGVAPISLDRPGAARLLLGRPITASAAAAAASAALEGARPLRKNGYKVALTANMVRRALLSLAERTA